MRFRSKSARLLSLTKKISLIYFVGVVFVSLLLSLMLFSYFKKDVEKALLSSYTASIDSNLNNIRDRMIRLDMCLNEVALPNGTVLTALKEYDGQILTGYNSYMDIKESFSAVYDVVTDSSVLFMVTNDMPLSDLLRPLTLNALRPNSYRYADLTPSEPYQEEAWYLYAQQHPDENYWFILSENPDKLYLVRHYDPVRCYNGYNQKVERYSLGTVLIIMENEFLNRSISYIDNDSVCFLIDAEQQVLHSSVPDAFGRPIAEILDAMPNQLARFDGQDYYYWANELVNGLSFITLLPQSQISHLTMGSLYIAILLAILLVSAGVLLMIALSSYVSKPIAMLARHMQTTELRTIAKKRRHLSQEVNLLYDSFNEQTEKIQRLIEEVHTSEQLKSKTEMKLLQAQIDPHFICSALDSVCCRSLMRGDNDLADILTDLSNIIRYNLRHPEHLISLSTELDIIHSYINIQSMRSNQPILYHEDVDDACLDAQVPKLILQPIVENGFTHTDSEVPITVEIRQIDGKLIIHVQNHSAAICAQQINEHLQGTVRLKTHSTGLSVRNIDMRLKLLYGDDYLFTYTDLPDNVLQAEVILPYDPMPPETEQAQ